MLHFFRNEKKLYVGKNLVSMFLGSINVDRGSTGEVEKNRDISGTLVGGTKNLYD